MACGSNCCAPPAPPPVSVNEAADESRGGEREDECCASETSGCKDGCCAGEVPEVASGCKDACCSPEVAGTASGCKDGCCESEVAGAASVCEDGCCAGEVAEATSGCKDDCCSGEMAEAVSGCTDGCCEPSPTPSCCVGKSLPCCDTACLNELALGECEARKDSCCTGSSAGQPCEEHVRTTREQYAGRLEALGCICRLLLSLGRESCCDRKERRRRQLPRKTRVARSAQAAPKSCVDACCDEKEASASASAAVSKPVSPLDLEGGTSASQAEHVVLSISGMTCTGCETKLSRSLGSVPAVANLKTSLVLSRAEFDLLPGMASVDDIMRHLAHTTEFTCERVATTGARLDVVVPGGTSRMERLQQQAERWPQGVTDVQVVDKQTMRISFDPVVIGARDLLSSAWASGDENDESEDDCLQLAPPPPADPTLQAGRAHVRHLAGSMALSVVLTVPVLVMAWAPLPEHEVAYGAASLALATTVQVAVAGPFYSRALKSLVFAHMVEMDLLVVLSTSAAYIFSVVSFGFLAAGRPLSTGQFFETSTLLVTLILVGRFVGALARQRAVEAMSLRSLQVANVYLDEQTTPVDARLLQYGDVFRVPPDSRVPTDGTVLAGVSEVDESMITGEALPVAKQPGSAVVAGTRNSSGLLRVRLTRLPDDNTVSALASLADEARLTKPPVQALADRVASWFVPVVISLAVLTFLVWMAVGKAVRHQSSADAAIQAVIYAITVLIVSCPCAIGLAVPMVVVVASGVAARHGVLFASSAALEVAHRTKHVVFDKTGTLTEGRLTVVSEFYHVTEARSLLRGLLDGIKHPVSQAVAAHLADMTAAPVADVTVLAGQGLEGTWVATGQVLRAGNARWLGLEDDDCVRQTASAAGPCSIFCFTIDGTVAAVLGLVDTVRADASATVASLHRASISVHILSGDDTAAVDAVAAQLQVPPAHVRSRCTPADKRDYVQALQAAGDVLFCGDGTNDAPALAQATVGVHMAPEDDANDSSSLAQATADIVLIRPCVSAVLTVLAVSRAAVHRIAFNFVWSAIYNVAAILLAAGAFEAVHAYIPAAYAGLGELVSVLPVIAVAMQLRWAKV